MTLWLYHLITEPLPSTIRDRGVVIDSNWYVSCNATYPVILQGVVRLEYVTNTADYIDTIMEKVKAKYLTQAYKVSAVWSIFNFW